ncbi:MAG: tRNA (adenosine(37)-N6)-dimethylallyltransferase MiaA [Campylobacterota bacterium]|nr:tRNA (adenosine(37)-N6)-dimethylallyltransferase MiaA [Campylobacterota bacterium]
MNDQIRQIAIIGPTASGKSGLAVKIAKSYSAIILSLDSLSIYKEIDIASAKPTKQDRDGISHYGIDVIYPDESFDVTMFSKLYLQAYAKAESQRKNLIIVGGTGFYLKSLMDGISTLPLLSRSQKDRVDTMMANPPKAYEMLLTLDPLYMRNIASSDRYRIEKALSILFATEQIPSQYFGAHPPIPTIAGQLPIYRIVTDRGVLRSRIAARTKQMIKMGLIDEISYLEQKYSRKPNCMKAIGVKETLDFLDGRYDRAGLEEKIITNTARLAKRQTTFNRSQFKSHISLEIETLEKKIIEDIEKRP